MWWWMCALAAPPTALQEPEAPAFDSPTLTPFEDHYQADGIGLRLLGFAPPGVGHPLHIFVGGAGEHTEEDAAELNFAREMASRGFVSALVEYPGQPLHEEPEGYDENTMVELRCEGSNHSLRHYSERIFAYSGSADTQPTSGQSNVSALATLCARPEVDCGAGISIHCASLGCLIANLVRARWGGAERARALL
jgi:hypothetical protein